MRETFERKKYCPVCHGLAAVLDGDPEKYGSKAVGWHSFIRKKYCCDECRDIVNGQNRRLADKRYRARKRQWTEAALDAIDALKAEVKASRERESLLETENCLLKRENRDRQQRISELEAVAWRS